MKIFSRVLQALAAVALCVVTACSDKTVPVSVPAGADVALVMYQLNEAVPAKVEAAWRQASEQVCRELGLPPQEGADPASVMISMLQQFVPADGARIITNVLGLKAGQKNLSANTIALTWKSPASLQGDLESPATVREGLAVTVLNKDFDYAAFCSDLYAMDPKAEQVLKREGDWLKFNEEEMGKNLGGLFVGFREAKNKGLVYLIAKNMEKAEESYAGGSVDGAVAWALSTKGLADGPAFRLGVNNVGALLQKCAGPSEMRMILKEMPSLLDVTALKVEVAYEGVALKITLEVEASEADSLKPLEVMAWESLMQGRMMAKMMESSALGTFLDGVTIEMKKKTLAISCKIEPDWVVDVLKEYAAERAREMERYNRNFY